MKAGFKFPEALTASEIEAFRRYEERVKPVMEEYRRKVDELNASYDVALDRYGDEYDQKLQDLSDLHDQERQQTNPTCHSHPHPERLSTVCRRCGDKLPVPVDNFSDAWCRACMSISDKARDQSIAISEERCRLIQGGRR
jgi:hypothetical protein